MDERYEIPGALVHDRTVTVPLHWGRDDGGSLPVFVRELVRPDQRDRDLPLLLFLQGGPGGKSPRPTRGGWSANEVPVDAAVYFDDMYVDADLSLETAAAVGNVRTWVTNEFEHDGLRTGDVLDHLLAVRSR